MLIAVFALYPQRAIRINLLISLATLATAAVARLGFLHETRVASYRLELVAMLVGGVAAAWIGAGLLSRIPKDRLMLVIAILLVAIAVLLVVETSFAGSTAVALPPDPLLRGGVALLAGLVVGAIGSLLGVAGGEFVIPILIFIFGADIKTAGTASVLISTPIVVAGVARHVLAGRFRSRTIARLSRAAHERRIDLWRRDRRLSLRLGSWRCVARHACRRPARVRDQVVAHGV